jgi:predicted transcriptional regulator
MKTHTAGVGKTAFIEIPAELAGELEKEAKRSRKTIAKLMEQAIEDMRDSRAIDAAYKKHLKSGGKTFSLNEVKEKLGLAG